MTVRWHHPVGRKRAAMTPEVTSSNPPDSVIDREQNSVTIFITKRHAKCSGPVMHGETASCADTEKRFLKVEFPEGETVEKAAKRGKNMKRKCLLRETLGIYFQHSSLSFSSLSFFLFHISPFLPLFFTPSLSSSSLSLFLSVPHLFPSSSVLYLSLSLLHLSFSIFLFHISPFLPLFFTSLSLLHLSFSFFLFHICLS